MSGSGGNCAASPGYGEAIMTTEMVRYQQPTAMMRFQPETLEDIMQIARMFEASGMFPTDTGKTQSAAQLAVKILAGQELGLTPFAAANGMQIIKGKCTPSANVMAAKVKASGRYSYRVAEMTDAKVSIDFLENGQPIGTSTFTAADAAKAGTQNMGKFPRNMLFARAISNGAKWFCPDIFNGVAVYTPDEMGATVDYETGEIISMPVEPVTTNGNGHTEPSTQTNGASKAPARVIEVPTEESMTVEHGENLMAVFEDNPFVSEQPKPSQKVAGALQITEHQKGVLHAIGEACYNGGWDDKRHELVSKITCGRTQSSNDLTSKEAAKMIHGIEAKVREKYESAAQPLIEAGQVDALADIDELDGVGLANALKTLNESLQPEAA